MNDVATSGLRRRGITRGYPIRDSRARGEFVLNLTDVGRILRRNLLLIGLSALLGGGIAAYIALRTAPVYVAAAEVMLGNASRADDALGSLFQGAELSNGEIYGEISVINSGRFLTRVSESLSLSQHPQFNPALGPMAEEPGLLVTAVTSLKAGIKTLLGGDTASAFPQASRGAGDLGAPDPILDAAGAEARVRGDQAEFVQGLARGLKIRQQGLSPVLSIHFASPDPMVAAAVVNTVADEYVDFQLEDKLLAMRRVTDGLNDRISDLRTRLEESERAVIDFRSRSIGTESGTAETLEQQMRELSTRLVSASAERAELEAERREIAGLADREGAEAAAGVLQSDLISELQSQKAELQQNRARVIDRFGEGSVRLEAIHVALAQNAQALQDEVDRVLKDMDNRVAVLLAREASLREQADSMETRYLDWAQKQIALTSLERELDANRIVYETFLTTFTENTEMVSLQAADARVLNYAVPPPNPVAPRKKISVALGLIAGLCAGLGLAFLRAFLRTPIDDAARLRRVLGEVPVYATLPKLRKWLRPVDPVRDLGTGPNAPLEEAVRTLRNLLLIGRGQSRRKIAIMSAVEGEGKTTTALLLAHAMAQAGKSVVVVETDLRRGSMARRSYISYSYTLQDALRLGDVPLAEVLMRDATTGAVIIPARTTHGDPAAVLLSDKFRNFLGALEKQFDIVILDTPPVLAVSDALPLLKMSDEIVLAARSKRRSVAQIEACLGRLEEAGIEPTCAILTMAPRQAMSSYGVDYDVRLAP